MNEYSSPSWHAFRNEVFRRHDYACTSCGKRGSDDAGLHVHHKSHLVGHKPWEYPLDLCITLCDDCEVAAHGASTPMFGWDVVGCDDLGEAEGNCDHCGTAIRYVFMVQHPKWRTLEVGEECCDNLTCTKVASDHMDSLRRQQERLRRFVLSSRWKVDSAGVHRIKHKQNLLEVVLHQGTYRLRVDWEVGKKAFASIPEARAAAFDLVESGAIDAWRERRSKRQRRDPFDIAPGGARRS